MSKGTHTSEYSEDALVEQPAIALFNELGWQTANLDNESFGASGTEGRESEHEVILPRRLRTALERLNPDFPPEALDSAYAEIIRDRSSLTAENANRELYLLLKNGVRKTWRWVSPQSSTIDSAF